jgi:integrase
MKEGEEHVVPLSPPVVTLLKSLHSYTTASGYVFPSDKLKNGNIAPITIAAPYKLFKEMEPSYTVHGLRSTFRSWAGATTDYPEELLEAALAHKLKDKVKAAYMRDKLIDKRRPLMDDWTNYCLGGNQ